MQVRFDSARHAYYDAATNRRVPGVTQILTDEGLIDYSFLDPDRRAQVLYRGRWVHAAAAIRFQRGRPLPRSISRGHAMYDGYLEALESFHAAHSITPMLIEQVVVNPESLYAGTLDLASIIDDWLVVLDLKTGDDEPWHRIQTALYRLALPYLPDYQFATDPHRRATLHLRRDGNYAIQWHDDVRDLAWARALVAAWHAKVELGYLDPEKEAE